MNKATHGKYFVVKNKIDESGVAVMVFSDFIWIFYVTMLFAINFNFGIEFFINLMYNINPSLCEGGKSKSVRILFTHSWNLLTLEPHL